MHHTRRARWHPETFVCAFEGHVTPAADVSRLRGEDARLGVDLPDGRRLVRCIRCDSWKETTPPAAPARELLPALDRLEVPKRGKALRDTMVLRLIALDRALHAVLFGLLAALLIYVYVRYGSVQAESQAILRALERFLGDTGQAASRSFLVRELGKLQSLRRQSVGLLAGTAIAYCVVEGVEAVGLWLERRWAEYLTAIATAGFVPFEVRELIRRVTVLRVAALLVNLAILVWLVWRKGLFGLGRGSRDEEPLDRGALFGVPPEPAAL